MAEQPKWFKSSKCETGSCAEVAMEPDKVLFRNNSINPDTILTFEPAVWQAFIDRLKQDYADA